ncbi:hypothetical protein Nepgr_002159 [Nepenthes gracilis]|uniref:Uncharacterized protein n=1 Tax=Nepenthes gracilis TaxID=150966 RepID=A0AAD3RYA2_NEPGR|nr:hypothetical protein Nepgr_002159 [Nepenthes gracilis]
MFRRLSLDSIKSSDPDLTQRRRKRVDGRIYTERGQRLLGDTTIPSDEDDQPASPSIPLNCWREEEGVLRVLTSSVLSPPSLQSSSAGMLGKSMSSPVLTIDYATRLSFSIPDASKPAPATLLLNINTPNVTPLKSIRDWKSNHSSQGWELHSISTSQATSITSSNEDTKAWEACRQVLSAFSFSIEEQDKILGKAFGKIHSPYWSEERRVEVPNCKTVESILNYLRSLSLSDDDLFKLLKKFPEVLGCSLENELKNNVKILQKEWGIEGKSLRNLILRNPKVLGYNVDCKGDCMAQCTRCWARF